MYAPSSNSSLQNVLKQSKVNAVNQPTSSTQGNNRGLSVQELKAMTAMRLSHDNNNESKSTIRRSNPAEINASQPPTSQRSFNSLNNIAVSQDRVKPIPSNAGLSVQDIKELTKMRLSKLHASSSDSGDMRYETESNHSGTSFKGLISNGSVYYLGPNGGKSGTVTPDMESLIDDADLPYYNQLHTQQIQRHIGGFLQAPKKPTEAQPVGIAPKQSYSSAKQMISSDVLLAKNVPVFQGHVSNRENTQSYPQYASSDRIYNPSTSQSGTVSGVSLENSGKMRGTTANDPQAYVQQLASKISSHLMQQQQVQQRPTCPPVTTDQSHFATSHGIAGGYDMAPGHNLSKSTLHPDSNPSSYCKSSKTDKTHVTDGGGLHNIYTQKLVSSSFSDRLSKTTSEDSYYSNPSSNHGIFGSNFQQQHQNHIYNATQPFNTSVADKSSYVNDFFDTSRSTGSDDFNFSTGAIRDIMEGTGPSGGLYSEQSDASLFVRITRTDSLQDYGDEKLMSSRHNNEDQLFNLQQDSQGFRSHLDPLVQNSFGDSSTEISKTPFGGLRKKSNSDRISNSVAFGGLLFSEPETVKAIVPQLDVSGITLMQPPGLSSIALVSPLSRSRAASSSNAHFHDSSPPTSPKSMKHKSKLPIPFPASLRSRSTSDSANMQFEIVESVLNALAESMSPNGSARNTPNTRPRRNVSPGGRHPSNSNFLNSAERLYFDTNISPALSPDKLHSTMSL